MKHKEPTFASLEISITEKSGFLFVARTSVKDFVQEREREFNETTLSLNILNSVH